MSKNAIVRIPIPLKRIGVPLGTNAPHDSHLNSLTPINIAHGIAHPHSGVFFSRGLLHFHSPTIGGTPLKHGDYASPKSWLPKSFAGGLLVESSSFRPPTESEGTDLLFGFFPTNWYHWLLHILPKIWAQSVIGDKNTRNLVLSKSVMADTFLESLSAVLPANYRLSFVSPEPIAVRNSRFLLSPFPEAPGLRKTSADESPVLGEFCVSCAREYRDHIFSKVSFETSGRGDSENWVRRSGKRLFLSRRGQSRPTSETSLYEGLENRGFDIVDLESASFFDQVQMFKGAELIVGVTGAAFAGLLFARRSKVVVMQPSFLGRSVFSELSLIGHNKLNTYMFETRENSWRGYYRSTATVELNKNHFFRELDKIIGSD